MPIGKIFLLCALSVVGVLSAHEEIRATIEFNQQGVVGQIVFTALENGSTQIDTSFQPGNFSSWHVHPFPVDFTDDPATRCAPANRVGPHYDPSHRMEAAGDDYDDLCNSSYPLMCEAGDLSGKFGSLQAGNFTFIDNDPEFQLRGRYSVIGRSIIIHPPGHGMHLACANIHLDEDDNPGLYVAHFMGPRVGGSIYFRQSGHVPVIGVYIYANLYYTDSSASTTMRHGWGIYTDTPSDILDYSQSICDDIGSLYNPTNAELNDPQCNSSNIGPCIVGDMSAKLGYVTINSNPDDRMATAWTDENLFNYTYVGKTIGVRAADIGDEIIACAQIVPVAQIMARANQPPAASSLFTFHQRSPFDPTYINLPADLPDGDYQINLDGNIRDDDTCYSNMVFTPFTPIMDEDTLDSFAVGDLSGKHNFVADSSIEDIILPLSNRGSALGHNFMLTPTTGNASCGTIDLPMASSNVRVVVARITINTTEIYGNLYMRQVVTGSKGMYAHWPTVINWLLVYKDQGMARTTNYNWEVRMGSCGSAGQTYNPYGVTIGSAVEMVTCNEATGSYYHKRCAVGDLSGKNGQVTVRAQNPSMRTLVATDSNLPLVGPYTVLGRSLVLYSNTDNSMIGCGQILPENLSTMKVMLSFPVSNGVDHRVMLPIAIVDLVNANDVSYGEVIILEMLITAAGGGSQQCTNVTLGFTHFEGGNNADNIAMRVRQLYQNDLPIMYQRGGCPEGDLQQGTGGGGNGGGFIKRPFGILTNILILIFIFVLLN